MTQENVLDSADAVLVIDMQNSFLRPGGAMYQHRGGALRDPGGTTKRVSEVVVAATASRIPVIYTRHCYRPGYADAGSRTLRLFRSMDTEPLVRGTWDADIVDELKPGAGAAVVDKTRMDAFHNTDLEVLIHGISATRLVVTGIVTNACVETTTRSAAMRDLDVTILKNCCTTYSAEHQANALQALEFYRFAEVESWSGAASRPESTRELLRAITLAGIAASFPCAASTRGRRRFGWTAR
jgi:ureidoacrylate peracid hydrolase